jgi:photosystem II stability/assembly factor-like uncharacterized protein
MLMAVGDASLPIGGRVLREILFYNPAVRIVFILLMLSSHAIGQLWSVQTSGLDTNLRGVSAKYIRIKGRQHLTVWASGSNGVILRSTDEGGAWKRLTVADATDLDFRDIEGFDADTAYVMSSGEGDKSRIYKTADGGKTWALQYSDKRPGFFLDSLACDSKIHCVALSDPFDSKFLVVSTNDGQRWKELPRDKMPAILNGEGAFAASGTAIALCGRGNIYFGTGGGRAARVFHSGDNGRSWAAVETPISSGNASSGIFSIACGASLIVAVGGDYKEPGSAKGVAAYSYDFGATWRLAEQQPGGYRSAVTSLSDGNFVAVGPNGTDIARYQDREGMHWEHADAMNLNAASFDHREGWAVGPRGTIARFNTHLVSRISYGEPSAAKPVRTPRP